MVLRKSLIILIALLLPATAFAAKKYVVKKGDNLYDLSRKLGVSVGELKSINNLENDRLDIGDVLTIDDSVSTEKTDENIARGNNKEYFVKSGDTLGKIAEKYSVSAEDLQKANDLKTTNLQIGQKLLIPSLNSESVAVKAAEVSTKAETSSEATVKEPDSVKSPSAVPAEYAVQKDDTLGHIALKFNVSSGDIKKANGLKNDKLQIGQTLRIPAPDEITGAVQAQAVKVAAADTSARTESGYYIVEKGDTPGEIAEKLGVGTDELIKLNNLNSKTLRIGQRLIVPGSQPQAATRDTAKTAAAESQDNIQKTKEVRSPGTAKVTQAQYIVQKGDTPGEIAGKLGVGTHELITLNNLDSNKLRIGQVLTVPGAQSENGKEAVSPDTETEAANRDEAADKPKTREEMPSEYTVKKGDTLCDLAKKFGVSVGSIKKSNDLKTDNLRIGQKLALNVSGTSVAVQEAGQDTDKKAQSGPEAEKTTTAKYTQQYTVRRGDTIGHLAIKFGVSQGDLKNANGLRGNSLRAGQVLMVPGTEAAAETEDIVVRETAPEPVSEKIYIKKRYVVKAGDSLSSIANGFGVTVAEIKKASALKNDIINKGDILLIPVPQGKVASSNYKYTVATGDSLGKISKKFGVPLKELRDINGLAADNIRVGTKLNIPGLYSPEASESPAENIGAASSKAEYVVKQGDSLGRVARRFGVTIKALKRENNIKGNSINAGQVLYIPGSGRQEAEYLAVTKANIVQDSNGRLNTTNGQSKYSEPQVQNGRFSKESIIQVAKRYLGAPYKFGGYDLTTGIDCSGYVKKIFSRFNVYLPRTARDIYYSAGSSVTKRNLDTGDLVFFHTYAKYPSHVGIYIGNDEFIHASSASRMVTIDSMNKQYYRARYIGAKRIALSGLFYDELSKDYAGFEN